MSKKLLFITLYSLSLFSADPMVFVDDTALVLPNAVTDDDQVLPPIINLTDSHQAAGLQPVAAAPLYRPCNFCARAIDISSDNFISCNNPQCQTKHFVCRCHINSFLVRSHQPFGEPGADIIRNKLSEIRFECGNLSQDGIDELLDYNKKIIALSRNKQRCGYCCWGSLTSCAHTGIWVLIFLAASRVVQ
ncbi:hypothetical protein A3F66_03965 [candidate division TM6 bacterium RIFCSPHIGHO2_12_FULL_32_22]|nr:MAG: hypothetical protein A3F66_03965 [candidate division TM6 bacterium RIFCSPHIGHO2_12_FULL_32_22]